MPTCNRFLMSLPLEQFFSAVLLGIFPIQNLEPSAVLSLCDVGCRFLLGNDALQVQFRLAEINRSRSHQYTRYISTERRPVPTAAEVPVCDPATAQFANLCRCRST